MNHDGAHPDILSFHWPSPLLGLQHAEKAATTKAKMEAQVQQHVLQHERMLKDNHAHWQQLQVPHLGHGQPMPYGTHMPHGPRMPYGGY